MWRIINLVNLSLNYRHIYGPLSLNELRPRKIMNWQASGDCLIKLVFWIFNLQGEYYILGLFCRKPWFTAVIFVFRNRDAANILIDYPILLNLGFSSQHPLAAVCSIDAIKPWINICPMDQTKFFQLGTVLLWENTYGCMTTRRLIIQWSQNVLIIDIIIPWKFFWDQGFKQFEYYTNGIRKQHFSNQRESLSQSYSCIAVKTDYRIAKYK